MVTRSENLSESTFVAEHQTTSHTTEKGSFISIRTEKRTMYNTKPDLPENLREQAEVYILSRGRAPPCHSCPRILSILCFCAQADDEDHYLSDS